MNGFHIKRKMSQIVSELSMHDLNHRFFEIMKSESNAEEAADFIFEHICEDVALGCIFEFHHGLKTGLTSLIEGEREDEEPYKIVNSPECDVFGFSLLKKPPDTNCFCPNCDRPVSATRFAPHLEKCMVVLSTEQRFRLIWEQMTVEFKARGLMPPVFTPLNDDYTINFKAIAGYAKFLATSGIKSVLVGGTTGEHMSLSVSERKKVIDEWVIAGKKTGLHIMVQVGGAPLADVIALAEYCSQAGVDSLLTLPELYFKPASVDELVSYVELVANAAPNLPVLYYHIPSMSKVEINMPAFVSAASKRIPNFKGIKFTSNDLSEGAQVLRNLKNGQEMFLGADTLLAPAALLGIKSSIGTSFNLFPRLAKDILDAVEASDIERARALQEKLSLAIEAHTSEGPWVPIMKAGMEIVTGIKVGPPSLPQREIPSEAKARIATKLKALKVID